jgi:DNA-binding MarR family transcriptional regulator
MRASHIRDIRSFNKFYARALAALDVYGSENGYSLPEVTIIFELCHNDKLTASDLMMLLGFDKGYLSRILQKMEREKLITRVADKTDRRSICLQLTAKGKKEYEQLNAASESIMRKMFAGLSDLECERLVQKMKEIQQLMQRK